MTRLPIGPSNVQFIGETLMRVVFTEVEGKPE